MKIVTNSPYYSHFNLIEYEFFNIKIHLYKELLKDCKELEERIKNVIKSEDNKKKKKIYVNGLRAYYEFADKHKFDNIEQIINNK